MFIGIFKGLWLHNNSDVAKAFGLPAVPGGQPDISFLFSSFDGEKGSKNPIRQL
jgi:hypothetical protein